MDKRCYPLTVRLLIDRALLLLLEQRGSFLCASKAAPEHLATLPTNLLHDVGIL
jgi:hypothetical protein